MKVYMMRVAKTGQLIPGRCYDSPTKAKQHCPNGWCWEVVECELTPGKVIKRGSRCPPETPQATMGHPTDSEGTPV